jgi:hypothetical protein
LLALQRAAHGIRNGSRGTSRERGP